MCMCVCVCVNLQCFNAFANKQTRTVYLVLEYCNMGTLKSYVENKKRLSEKEGKVYKLDCILHTIANHPLQLWISIMGSTHLTLLLFSA